MDAGCDGSRDERHGRRLLRPDGGRVPQLPARLQLQPGGESCHRPPHDARTEYYISG